MSTINHSDHHRRRRGAVVETRESLTNEVSDLQKALDRAEHIHEQIIAWQQDSEKRVHNLRRSIRQLAGELDNQIIIRNRMSQSTDSQQQLAIDAQEAVIMSCRRRIEKTVALLEHSSGQAVGLYCSIDKAADVEAETRNELSIKIRELECFQGY